MTEMKRIDTLVEIHNIISTQFSLTSQPQYQYPSVSFKYSNETGISKEISWNVEQFVEMQCVQILLLAVPFIRSQVQVFATVIPN